MGKHTPGPWTVRNNGPHWNNPAIVNFDICWSPDGERVAEHVYEEADARLIAAAPELLGQHEADMVDLDLLAKAIHEGDPMLEWVIRITDMLNRKRAAIAKATP